MIILTAGHTGAHTSAQCTETHFDEGTENIWLRNRIAENLTNKYNLIVLIDNNHASLQLLTKELSRDTACRILSVARPNERLKPIPISADTIEITLHSRDTACCVRSPQRSKNNPTSVEIQRALLTKSNSESLNPNGKKSFQSVPSVGEKSNLDAKKSVEIQRALLTKSNSESSNPNGKKSFQSVLSVGEKNNSEGVKSVDHRPLNRRSLSLWRKNVDDFVIDIHFNAHPNPQARGTEAIVSDNATTMELKFASRLAHTTAEALGIPLRSIKSESETPHHRLAMLHLTPQSIILEICFCTSPEDVAQYHQHREHIATTLAHHIAELLQPLL